MPITSTTFVRSTIVLLVVGFLAVVAIVAAALWLAGRVETFTTSLATALEIRREVFEVRALAVDAETGQRGFLLTQDESYLAPYEAALAGIEREVTDLMATIEADQALAAMGEHLNSLLDIKLAELAETVALTRAGDVDAALELVRSDAGLQTMDDIREASGAMIAESNRMVTQYTGELSASSRTLIAVLVAGGLIIVAVVGGATWIAWRYTRDLVAARNEVMELNVSLEDRVRERTVEVDRANEEIQRFAYIVSHDLRSPLVNVMGFTSELEASLPALNTLAEQASDQDDPAVKAARMAAEVDIPEALGFIRTSTNKMDSLINAILKLSREGRRTLVRERIDMAALLEANAANVVHRLSEHGGEIEVISPIPDVYSDRLALEQVFGNLIDNAVKYLAPGRPGRIVLRASQSPNGVEYEIEDNGRGIAPEDHGRVFEPFRRAGVQDQPGEGIGLSHTRALVRRMGGEITLQSQLGKGTTFRVRLPKALPHLREIA